MRHGLKCAWAWVCCLAMLPGQAVANTPDLGTPDLSQRRLQVESLSPAEKEKLRQQQERFAALPAAEREKLRQLDSQLADDPRADELRRVMTRYHEWLKQLHPAQREELRHLPAAERLARIQALRRDEQSRDASPLPAEDRQALVAWLEEVLRSKLAPDDLRKWDLMSPGDRQLAMRVQLQKRLRQSPGPRLPEISAEQLRKLEERLSPAARLNLENKRDPQSKRNLVGRWLMQTLRAAEHAGPETMAAMISQDELEQFRREGVTDQQRQELERMAPFERQRRIRMMYLNWKYPDRPWREPLGGAQPRPNAGERRPGGAPGGGKRRPNNAGVKGAAASPAMREDVDAADDESNAEPATGAKRNVRKRANPTKAPPGKPS